MDDWVIDEQNSKSMDIDGNQQTHNIRIYSCFHMFTCLCTHTSRFLEPEPQKGSRRPVEIAQIKFVLMQKGLKKNNNNDLKEKEQVT